MEAETAAAAHVQRPREAERGKAQATAAGNRMHRQREGPIFDRSRAAAAKARAARERPIEAAENRDVEPPDLEPLAPEADATPWSGEKGRMAHRRKTKPSGTSPTPTAIS